MKKYLLLLCFASVCVNGIAQDNAAEAPYKKVPVFPPMKLVLPGNTIFTKDDLPKKKSVMLMIFSPMCEHCRQETEEILKNINLFSHSVIVMATMMPYDSMMSFHEKYNLAAYKNIIVGQDTQFFLPSFFMLSYLPFLAFYDKKGNFISTFQGNMPVDDAALELHKQAKKD